MVHVRTSELNGRSRRMDCWIAATSASVKDEFMPRLSRRLSLRVLYFDRTQVTDAGLDHLRHLKQLQWVRLSGAPVTPNGLRDLQANLPWVEFEH